MSETLQWGRDQMIAERLSTFPNCDVTRSFNGAAIR